MSHANVYPSGPLKGRPIRSGKAPAGAALSVFNLAGVKLPDLTGQDAKRVWVDEAGEPQIEAVRIHLTDADMDDWRDKVVWADFGATAGDQALNDRAIDDAAIPADAAAPSIDWRAARRGPRLPLPITVILLGIVVTYFAWRIVA
ncbi:MAG: hypothetical protein ACT6TH_14460 [Brevundimonas sp.]|uniref:hypothetical protein n=1 Tax=Brevundimonas sp. TaxID=1871086 RepID=UPI004033A145